MKTFFGIPAHPLLVHVPAVLLPLAAIGVVMMVIKPAWHERYRWAVLAIGFVGVVGAILAASAGESLGDRIRSTKGRAAGSWGDHAAAGETARTFAIIFFIVLAAFILVPWYLERRRTHNQSTLTLPKWASTAMAVLVLAGSVGTVVTVILAGHSGAKAVWCETATPPNCDTGG